MGQIYVDYIRGASGIFEKAPYVEKMVAYFDSLHMCCENKEIDKKNRKDCDKLVEKVDSTGVQFWREFYNKGLEQLTSLEEFAEEQKTAEDSSMLEYYSKTIQAKSDSSIENMKMTILIDSSDYRPYVAIGTILEKQGKYEEAIDWLSRGLNYTDDSSSLLLSVAYDYINIDNYCGAVPYFENYIRLNPDDLPNANNLTICYIRCDQTDKAIDLYRQMLQTDSTHSDALLGLGQYYRISASDRTKEAAQLSSEDKANEAKAKREEANAFFDSASTFYETHINTYPDNPAGYEEYGLISYIRGRYEKAAKSFKKLTELEPARVENWISLGDSYFNLKEFDGAISAYENAVKINKDNKQIWERLSFLYLEAGETAKKTKADKEVERLSRN